MARCRHYTEVVISLQPSVIYGCVPQVVKGEILYPGILAGGYETLFNGTYRTGSIGEHLHPWQTPGQIRIGDFLDAAGFLGL